MSRFQKKSSSKATIPSKLLLQLANQCENPLKVLPEFDQLEKCLQTQMSDFKAKVQCFPWSKLSSELQQWMIDLTEQNMKELYETSGWKWDRLSKLNEFKHTTAQHLIIFNMDSDQKPIGFVHFRFEEGYSSDATLYCYELQIESRYQRIGIGKFLMNILQTLAKKFRMKKVLVTVLKKNIHAFEFYTKTLQFKIDSNSPSRCEQEAVYEILSKKAEPANSK